MLSDRSRLLCVIDKCAENSSTCHLEKVALFQPHANEFEDLIDYEVGRWRGGVTFQVPFVFCKHTGNYLRCNNDAWCFPRPCIARAALGSCH